MTALGYVRRSKGSTPKLAPSAGVRGPSLDYS